MTRTMLCAATCALVLLVPVAASGQACIGVPVRDGQFAVEGSFSSTDGGKGLGAAVTGNLAGPLSLQGGYQMMDVDDIDDDIHTFSGLGAWELSGMSFSACPFAGASYASWSTTFLGFDLSVSQTVIPVGLGVGHTITSGSDVGLTIFAMPQFMHIRTSGSVEGGDIEEAETESTNEFGTHLGVRLGNGAFYGGGSVFLTSFEDVEPIFTVSVGIALGRAR